MYSAEILNDTVVLKAYWARDSEHTTNQDGSLTFRIIIKSLLRVGPRFFASHRALTTTDLVDWFVLKTTCTKPLLVFNHFLYVCPAAFRLHHATFRSHWSL